jgi:hypothetical protein
MVPASPVNELSPVHWFIVAFFFFMYFLPSIVGWSKRNFTAILWLNILAGWTFVGWIIALVWALTKEPSAA